MMKYNRNAALRLVSNKGFSMIEFMIVAALVAILTNLAAPPLNNLISRTDTRNVARAMQQDILLARSEARTRVSTTENGAPVTMCPYNNARNACHTAPLSANNEWVANGWLLFVDENGNGQFNAGEQVITQNTNFAGEDIQIIFGNNPNNNLVTFGLHGIDNATQIGQITISDQDSHNPKVVDVNI